MIGGLEARVLRSYRYRASAPGDRTLDGYPVAANQFVVVRLSACRVWTCDGKDCTRKLPHEHYDPKDAPQAVRLNYGGTWEGYGEWKRNFSNGLWYAPVWFAMNGVVYKATGRGEIQPPEDARLRLFGAGIIVGKDRVLA